MTVQNKSNQIPEWVILNNQIVDGDGNIKDLNKDKEAVRSYFLNEINKKTQFFHSLKEKLEYLTTNDYYETEFLEKYTFDQIQAVYDIAYDAKFRFPTYMGAFKFYNDYALKSIDAERVFLERYEDRLSVIALYHADGDFELAKKLITSLIAQDFTPATPTLLNTGKKKRGEFVSCFLLEVDDSLNDIARVQEFAMQLSKLGGGVSINLTNLRAKGESIKDIPNVAKGVVGVAKLLDNAFRYADQMGQRQGAGAVYLNVFHADIEDFLQTKKLNADDDVRVKTLSMGVVMPDKMIELAREDKDMYVFYPHTVYKEYGIPFSDVAIKMDEWYDKLVENPNVRKRKINPRKLFDMIAQLQGESGYPYIMYADNVNKENPLADPIKFSNLCTEILQPSIVSHYGDYHRRDEDEIGLDISCNLASGHMGNMIKNNSIKETVFAAMEIMNSVSEKTNIAHVPAVARANRIMRSVGFGVMGHHGYIAENFIAYGSEEDIDLIDVFFSLINYYSLVHSMEKAKETGEKFYGFERSSYADGSYFNDRGQVLPKTEVVKGLLADVEIPTDEDWAQLKEDVMAYGLYNSNRLAVAPNGSIAYVMSATPSLTPIKQVVEERTYGNSKTYFPMPAADVAGFMYESAYQMDKYKIIDVIATAQKHVDQGISFELCITSDETTRSLQRYYLYAHYQGIKTLYYTRTQKLRIDECESCAV
ncbi:class 1b ribonucleoside-diphosphate reductase subunit alpha [Erysipelothrix rhusiopathiae]|uniref:class 1b ribonucleoside-diphosphate reductase subunit alpha n=1 Tax=Erysipelothrix rhusiopathiae TaxID=1648 RepID=UPI000210B6BB|nr:class 1b ribonucleoside-diphosphate reductase subunit alpha [Erysipelothrix rhusiopathiae]AMS11634.1 ribonucleoside-diphosphate reductase subunit alpha [Erysipelothrix rhusiopathiae]AOO68133.1 ribonucleoside-diphosphate reductase subunit alpha [Erysipelothrix rhusiopathiae]AWU41018.1 class 1b ribonucleoside-diphosphate reductase subunit alpha [Erysipelothrix rhusiopathiae]MCG4435765.1 class 1b ribonucleoside-diphosphate reductase subunit alpha [Erysipelothrix rhusiopathiae]MCG4456887.1 clas